MSPLLMEADIMSQTAERPTQEQASLGVLATEVLTSETARSGLFPKCPSPIEWSKRR